MKVFSLLLFWSLAGLSMQLDPKNLRREQLESEFKKLQQTVAQQQQLIKGLAHSYRLLYDAHYGNFLEKICAQADLHKIEMAFLIKGNK